MKVKSFMRQNHELVPVELELSLAPGLPQISFLGLPDTAIRESVLRIKSALKQQNFEFPKSRQVLVHLKPSHLKKSSRGLDLAVAAALLWETEQIPKPLQDIFVYGELSLKGEVIVPDDVEEAAAFLEGKMELLTGRPSRAFSFALSGISELKDLTTPKIFGAQKDVTQVIRPLSRVSTFSVEQAELIKLIAVGEHSTLLAGPPGCGKTTVAECIGSFLQAPTLLQLRELKKIARRFRRKIDWRPVVTTHHSITPLSMLGGGVPLRPGELTRAHGGVLVMDELLEFSPKVQEALREPLESGQICMARQGRVEELPAKFILVGTTNLCPCGRYDLENENRCRCRLARRENYLSRLSGPFADRFTMFKVMSESDLLSRRDINFQVLLEEIRIAVEFRIESRDQNFPNADLDYLQLLRNSGWSEQSLLLELGDVASYRRQVSTLKVARSWADLERRQKISKQDLLKAKRFTSRDFVRLHTRDFIEK